ncbi:hypothetical protein D9758_007479 [Tetrapyrgos nigripes]|uniref:F-box domain-containing protein n=1 Tax=Tetrapyrgos nigripes TaxID=182062 RepID=A0A8H5G3C0_9AGAR|nr:hypothetical protein D9758_007479 [Tetrapyrgos nigripes]
MTLRCFKASRLVIKALELLLTLHSDIGSIDEEIRKLQTRRNSLVPISRLPNELLSTILMFCSQLKPDDDNDNDLRLFPPSRQRDRWPWTTVSHICSHWRNVALGCPVLWSCLDFSRPAWVPAMVERSRMVPLTLEVPFELVYHSQTEEAISTALQHMSRVKELSVSIPSGQAGRLKALIAGLQQPAPLLEVLYLDKFDFSPWDVNLPLEFLNGDAPRLRHLELRGFCLPLASGLLKNRLTSLVLFFSSPTDASWVQQLVRMLTSLCSLEVLGLKVPLSVKTISLTRVTHLPHLRSIELDAYITVCASLLDCISFPPTTTMQFSCAVSSPDQLIPQTSPISASLSRIRDLLLQSSSTTQFESMISSLIISTDTWDPKLALGNTSSKPWLELSFWFHDRPSPQSRSELFATILEAILPASNATVRLLTLEGLQRSWSSYQIWEKPASSLDSVRTLHVRGSCVRGILEWLTLTTPYPSQIDDSACADRFTFLPLLRSLHLSLVNFDLDNDNTYTTLEKLKGVLTMRSERQCKIEEVKLEKCFRLSNEHVESLREICADVRWDEVVDFLDEDD